MLRSDTADRGADVTARITVAVSNPETLADVLEWADAAGRVGIDNDAPVTMNVGGTQLAVSTPLDSIRGER